MIVEIGKHRISFSESAVKAHKNKSSFLKEMETAYGGKIDVDLKKVFGDVYDTIVKPPKSDKESK